MQETQIGEVENVPHEIKQIVWKIPGYFSVTEIKNCDVYPSPTFTIGGVSWQLRLFPKGLRNPGYIEFYLKSCWISKYPMPVEYFVGIKKGDGNMEQLVSGTLKKDYYWYNNGIYLIKKTELLQRKSQLVPCDVLTIICTLKIMTEISNFSQHTALDLTKPLKLIKLDKLSENFKDLFDDKESCDVTLKVKDKEYKAHKLVLIARSRVFAANFKHDTLEKQTGIITISDCDSDSFEEFLKYLYCGKLEELTFRSAVNLYYTSDKYDVSELKEFCVDFLKQSLAVENICEVVSFADTYDETTLFSAAQDFFNKNLNDILDTSEWECFMKMNCRLANKLLKAMAKVKCGE